MGILDAPALSPSAYSTLSRDASAGGADRDRSRALSQVAYDDAAQIIEAWASSAAWNPAAGVAVSAGIAYKGSANTGTAQACEVPAGTTAIITGSLAVAAAGGTAGLAMLGFSTDAAGVAPSAGSIRCIGVETNTNKVVYWTGVSGGNPEYVTTSGIASGIYSVTVAIGLTDVGFTIENADHTVKYQRVLPRPAEVHNLVVWNTDTRGTGGTGVGLLAAKKATGATLKPPVVRAGATSVLGASGSGVGLNAQRIVAPKNYDSRIPTPLVIYCHGLGGDVASPFNGSAKNFETAVVNAGYLFAASDGFSATHFGMEAAIQEYLRLYRNVRDTHNIGRICLIGESMGGLVSLNLLGRRLIPNIAAYVGIYPITSLEAAYASSTGWATQIRSNYGIAADGSDYNAKTAGYSPIKRAAEDYRGVPMRFWASPGDTLVSKSANTDAFAARVVGVTPEAGVVTTSGDHGDGSNFNATQQADLLAFLARNLGA